MMAMIHIGIKRRILKMNDYIKITVEVQGSYSPNVEMMLRRLYPGKVLYSELPENGRVISNKHFPVKFGIPSWGYTYFVEAR
jgi:hypothetical protein